MKLYVLKTEPVQEIAAEPGTLDRLTASLRAALEQRLGEPVAAAGMEFGGFRLVADDQLLPGVVHFRPSGHCPTAREELEQLLAWFDLKPEAAR